MSDSVTDTKQDRGSIAPRSAGKPVDSTPGVQPLTAFATLPIFSAWYCGAASDLLRAERLTVPYERSGPFERKSILMAFRFLDEGGRDVVDPRVRCSFSAALGHFFRYLGAEDEARAVCQGPGIEDGRIETVLCGLRILKLGQLEGVHFVGRPCLETSLLLSGRRFAALKPLSAWTAGQGD